MIAVAERTKKCGGKGKKGCGRELPHSWFRNSFQSSDGLYCLCRDCEAAYEKSRKRKRLEEDPVGEWAKRLVISAKATRGDTKPPCDLTDEWCAERLAAGVCEKTGLPFDLGPDPGPRSPSIDRIDPTRRGHMQKNCRVVLLWVNYAKHDFSEQEFDGVLAELIGSVLAGLVGSPDKLLSLVSQCHA
jgi:hypothetical protein